MKMEDGIWSQQVSTAFQNCAMCNVPGNLSEEHKIQNTEELMCDVVPPTCGCVFYLKNGQLNKIVDAHDSKKCHKISNKTLQNIKSLTIFLN
jgi:hypothetical protein